MADFECTYILWIVCTHRDPNHKPGRDWREISNQYNNHCRPKKFLMCTVYFEKTCGKVVTRNEYSETQPPERHHKRATNRRLPHNCCRDRQVELVPRLQGLPAYQTLCGSTETETARRLPGRLPSNEESFM